MNSETKSGLAGRIRDCAERVGSGDALARISGVPRRTLENYLSGKSEPKASALAAIADAADVSLDWLIRGDGPKPSGDRLSSRTVGELAGHVRAAPSADSLGPGFVLIPRYDVEASAGPGALSEMENVVDFLAFQENWVRYTLGLDPARLALITAVGDSMEPAIRAGDLLLIDTGIDRFVDDAIYVVAVDGRILVKRVQTFMGGAVTIKSDNPAYVEQTLSADEADEAHVAGRVRWIGRMI